MARWKVLQGVLSDKKAVPVSLGDYSTKAHKRTLKDWEPPEPPSDPRDLEAFKQKIAIWTPPELYPGDVFDSPTNMSRHNTQGSVRYVKVEDFLPEYSDELGDMTVAQLREFAENEEIDIPQKLNKAKLLQAIRSQLSFNEATAED
jgi:hypothetical protein